MKGRIAAIALIAFLGMVDTFYLSIKRDTGPVPCHITKGCNDVLTSPYSEIKGTGIPISAVGLLFYLTVFSLATFVLFDSLGAREFLRFLFWPAIAAFLVSVGLTGIQAFVLKAFCEYCLASAGLVTGIFLLTLGKPAARSKSATGVDAIKQTSR
jgi:uncharacterized membrane protein